VLFGIGFICSSAGETLSIKGLNYADTPVVLPLYTAFMSNQMWVLMLPFWFQLERRPLTLNYAIQYVGMGVLTGAVSLFRSISLNFISGSVYTILISTSILFNMLLSYVWLKKAFNKWHIVACICCVLSAISVGASAFNSSHNNVVGIASAFAASFCLALMTVSQEYIQKDWDDYTYRVTEMSMVASFLASVFLLPIAYGTKEIFEWAPTLKPTPLLIGISAALPILKMLVRTTKYATIQNSNAFFFEFVQSSGSLVTSVASILVFREPWNWAYGLSLTLLTLSFGFYIKARLESKKMSKIVLEPIVVVVSPWR